MIFFICVYIYLFTHLFIYSSQARLAAAQAAVQRREEEMARLAAAAAQAGPDAEELTWRFRNEASEALVVQLNKQVTEGLTTGCTPARKADPTLQSTYIYLKPTTAKAGLYRCGIVELSQRAPKRPFPADARRFRRCNPSIVKRVSAMQLRRVLGCKH